MTLRVVVVRFVVVHNYFLFGQDLHVFSVKFALPSRQGQNNSATKWHYDAISE